MPRVKENRENQSRSELKKIPDPISLLIIISISMYFGGCAVGTETAVVDLNQSQFTSYHIGNSLTWDMQPLGLVELASQMNYEHQTGYHIQCGQPLKYIWNNPTSTCVPPIEDFGYFGAALSSHSWDIVAIQPFQGDSTLQDDETIILDMIELSQENPENRNTRFYIYAAWPTRGDYQTKWTIDVPDDNSTSTVLASEYFEHLIERVRVGTTAQVFMIPVGEVLYELDKKLQAGEVPGYTSIEQMYRDDYHLTLDIGRFIAGITTFATIYGSDPTGIVQPENYYGERGTQFTPELYSAIYSTVCDVVSNSPYTGLCISE